MRTLGLLACLLAAWTSANAHAQLTAALEAEVVADDAAFFGGFGISVAMNDAGTRAVVGVPGLVTGATSVGDTVGGVVFLARGTGDWEVVDVAFGDTSRAGFAERVAMDAAGERVAVGAPSDGDGVVFVYRRDGDRWRIEDTLEPRLSTRSMRFGADLDLDGTGDRVVVGSPSYDLGAIDGAGAAYVFTRSGTRWTEETRLDLGTAAQRGDGLGGSVTIDADGRRLLIGARADRVTPTAARTGTARVYVRAGSTWTEEALLQGVGLADGDLYGDSLALSDDGDRAFVLAPRDVFGSVTVFGRSGTTWTRQTTLRASSGSSYDRIFIDGGGERLAIRFINDEVQLRARSSATTWTVEQTIRPARTVSSLGTGLAFDATGSRMLLGDGGAASARSSRGGEVRQYTRAGTTWTAGQRISDDGAGRGDRAGQSVAMSEAGDRLLVGIPERDAGAGEKVGAAEVWFRDAAGWTLEARLPATGIPQDGGFGSAVALSAAGDRAFVGADANLSFGRGAVLVFLRTGTTWALEATLRKPTSAIRDEFGASVACDAAGTRVIIGAPEDPASTGMRTTGSAHVFLRTGTTWASEQSFESPTPASSERFGSAVAIDDGGDRLVVSAPLADSRSGEASVWVRGTGAVAWTREVTVVGAARNDELGIAVALDASGTRLAVSLPVATTTASVASGSVRIYRRSTTSWFLEQTLVPDTTVATRIGQSLSFDDDGDLLAVGASGFAGSTLRGGTVRLFSRAATVWTEESLRALPVDESQALFGQAVSLDALGERLAVGAPQLDLSPPGTARFLQNAGRGFVFRIGEDLGSACSSDADCGGASVCADGVCCTSSCGARCEACDVPGQEGACVAVVGAPRGTRAACPGTGLCAGACDGSSRSACSFPGAEAVCGPGSCSAGVETPRVVCDGAGSCPAQLPTPCAPFQCGGDACATSCSTSAECLTGNFCIAEICQPPLADGEGCSAASDCASGFCVDGVCCDGACGGQCEACDVMGSEGACTAALGAPRGTRPACATDGTVCGGSCDGVLRASCAFPDATTECRSGSCAAGVAVLPAGCDAAGACPPEATALCAPFVCGADACATTCADDTGCTAGSFCDGAACVPVRGLGVACGRDGECGSGLCVDGVCCDGPCTGQCEACDRAGSEGTCGAVAGEPRGGRTACASDGTVCAGSCDGVRRDACAFPGSSVICREASCADGEVTLAAGCSGGSCPDPTVVACAPFTCGTGRCRGDCEVDADCVDDAFCGEGVCTALRALGAACGRPGECASGLCVDGVCCNGTCEQQCEACNADRREGFCTPVSGDPRGARPACASDGTLCGGACDGRRRDACTFPAASTVCSPASCVAGLEQPAGTCDAAGRCETPDPAACGDFACGDVACLSSCASRTDCAPGFVCTGGECTRFVLDDLGFTEDVVPPADGCRAGPQPHAPAFLLTLLALVRRRANRDRSP